MSPSRTLGCLLCLGVAVALPSHGALGIAQITILAHLYHAPCLVKCFPSEDAARKTSCDHVPPPPPPPPRSAAPSGSKPIWKAKDD